MSHLMIVIIAFIAAVFLAVFCVKLLMGVAAVALWLAIAAIKVGIFVFIASVLFVLIYGKLKRKTGQNKP
jgi:heme O synthase-like polyprenyltransferase